MEIKVETGSCSSRYGSRGQALDILLAGVDINRLPLLNGDEIREMARPVIETKIMLETGNRESAKKLSYLAVYGKERCHESFPWLFDKEQDSESNRSVQ